MSQCPKPRNSALSVCGYEAADGAPVADRKGKTSIILLAPIGQCFDEIARHAEALGRQLSASWSRQSPVAALVPVLDDPGSTCREGRCHGHGVLPSIEDRKSTRLTSSH